MEDISPRLWPYSPNNSPAPLPPRSFLFTSAKVLVLSAPCDHVTDEPLNIDGLRRIADEYQHSTGALSALLQAADAPGLDARKPVLLLGELANPYRLRDINIGVLPVLRVRLEGVCTTWSDGLDARDMQPGVHHVTLARTPGWWETVHLGLATVEQLKRIRTWIENGVPGSWRPVRLDEGSLRLEGDAPLDPPQVDDVAWDGTVERVERPTPSPSGPSIDLSAVMALVHTRQGCYNNRGRLARCAHLQQRAFHEGLFRRGSSHRWDAVLKVR